MPVALKHIVFRILLYFGLAFAFLAVCGLLVALSIREHIVDLGRWIFLAVYTGVLAWAAIAPFREIWNRAAFWLAVVGLLILHVLGFTFVLRAYADWRPIWFIPFVIIEAGLFGVFLTLIFPKAAR
jgi:hypothetical protein